MAQLRSFHWPRLYFLFISLLVIHEIRRQADRLRSNLVSNDRRYEEPTNHTVRSNESDGTHHRDDLVGWTAAETQALSVNGTIGTIILFFHISKTGGSTIRRNFITGKRGGSVEYMFFTNYKQYKKMEKRIENVLYHGGSVVENTKRGNILFLEVHAGDTPSFMDVRLDINRWRERARIVGMRFFAFTLLREPVARSVSAYNYRCLGITRCPAAAQQRRGVSDLLGYEHLGNFQSRSLTSGHYNFWDPSKVKNGTEIPDSEALLSALRKDLDWVGTTECLRQDTIPRLQELVPLFDPTSFRSDNVNRHNKEGDVSVDALDAAQRKILADMNVIDLFVYDRIKGDVNSTCTRGES